MLWIWWMVIGLLILKLSAELGLEWLNQRHTRRMGREMPDWCREVMDADAFGKATDYTLAKSRFSQFQAVVGLVNLLVLLGMYVFPGLQLGFVDALGEGVWSMAAFLYVSALCLSILGWPMSWYDQFHLEDRFGFNTTTPKTWWMDRIKGVALSFVLGYPLLAAILALFVKAGALWWLWAWLIVMGFQLLMMVLAPAWILPLFNRFEPLPEGDLRQRLLELAERAGFQARGIEVMDGSKRSRHSNAFFTGLGKRRKIVLFDTLVEQLEASELAAVLAHEIGHFRLRHIPKLIAWSGLMTLIGLFVIGWLARVPAFTAAFGFPPGDPAATLLLFGLLAGAATFWLTPIENIWSRKYEYEADAFARKLVDGAEPLILALRKLSEKNLSNLTPHPLYSGFYYSHPTLREREEAMTGASAP